MNDIEKKTEIIKEEIEGLSSYINFEIKNDEDETEATRIVQVAKKLMKTIDDELYKEQIESAKRTLALIKESRDKLIFIPQKISESLKQKIIDYKNEKKRIELEKTRRQIEEQAKEEIQIEEFFDISKEDINKKIDNSLKNVIYEIDKKMIDKNKADGIITARKLSVELIDMKMLLQAIIDGIAPVELVTFNQSFANNLAKNIIEYEKKDFNIPGLEAKLIDILKFKSL